MNWTIILFQSLHIDTLFHEKHMSTLETVQKTDHQPSMLGYLELFGLLYYHELQLIDGCLGNYGPIIVTLIAQTIPEIQSSNTSTQSSEASGVDNRPLWVAFASVSLRGDNTFDMKMSFTCKWLKIYFRMKGLALALALKQRLQATWPWWPACNKSHSSSPYFISWVFIFIGVFSSLL